MTLAGDRAPSVLVVEDEPGIGNFVARGLANRGFAVSSALSGGQALALSRQQDFDLAILDLMLPDIDGLDVCRELRRKSGIGIIVLTARNLLGDRVKGLEAGADDYLAKPFEFEELLARAKSVLRRRRGWNEGVIQVGDLQIDTTRRQTVRGSRRIDLTVREFDLLALLAQNAGRPLRHEVILERVWGHDSDAGPDIVKVYVAYLRQKLNAAGEPDLIESLRGFGYVLKTPS